MTLDLLYTRLQDTEQELAVSQFKSHTQRALKDCVDVVDRKRLSMESMASMMGEKFYNASDWPFVVVRGYETIVQKLSRSGGHTNMGFAPIVQAGKEQDAVSSLFYEIPLPYYSLI